MFRRLPPDNYPDDYDFPAYRNYEPGLKPGLRLWLVQNSRRVVVWLMTLSMIGAGFVATLLVLPPPDARVVVVTAQPSMTPVGDVQGDYPPNVIQRSITIPARIDEELLLGESHGYRFFAEPGITWQISVYPDSRFDPLLNLYNPDGIIMEIADDISADNLTSRITFTPPQSGQYALLIQSSAGGTTAGGYTLEILPIR